MEFVSLARTLSRGESFWNHRRDIWAELAQVSSRLLCPLSLHLVLLLGRQNFARTMSSFSTVRGRGV